MGFFVRNLMYTGPVSREGYFIYNSPSHKKAPFKVLSLLYTFQILNLYIKSLALVGDVDEAIFFFLAGLDY